MILDDETPPEDELCSHCNGCGEGMYEGTKCNKCGGSGVIKLTEEPDFDEQPRDGYDYRNG